MKNIIGITLVPLLLGAASVHADPLCTDDGEPWAKESKIILQIAGGTEGYQVSRCGSEPGGDYIDNVLIDVLLVSGVKKYRISENKLREILKIEALDSNGLPRKE